MTTVTSTGNLDSTMASPVTAVHRPTSDLVASTPDQRRAAAALRRATDDAADAARTRRVDRIAYAALALGLAISIGTFGLVAYDNSVSQSAGTAVSTTP